MPPIPNSKSITLVSANTLLAVIWPEEKDRPSIRWLREQQARRAIPFVKMGHLVFFDIDRVRAAIEGKFTMKARGV